MYIGYCFNYKLCFLFFLIEFMFNNYRHCAPPFPLPWQQETYALQGLGHMPPAVRTAVPRVISENKKRTLEAGCSAPPPAKTHQISRLFVPWGEERDTWQHPGGGAPGSPKPSCLISHFILQHASTFFSKDKCYSFLWIYHAIFI